MSREIRIAADVLALIRGEIAAPVLADKFGVAESEVHNWSDIFQVAGVVALMNALKSGTAWGEDWARSPYSDPSTPKPGSRRRRSFLDSDPTTHKPR